MSVGLVQSNTLFDARNWIATNCVGASQLHAETVGVVLNFTLMWGLFEGIEFENRAKPQKFESVAQRIAQRSPDIVGIKAAIEFWRKRYWTGSKFRELFDGLAFQDRDGRDKVEAVLRGENADSASQLLAAIIIVYRLRNNLFHGIKTIDMLNDQEPNLNTACQALACMLEASGNGLVQGQIAS